MDFMPDNEDVIKVDAPPAGLPDLPDEGDTVLEEEITSIAIDSLIAQPLAANISGKQQNQSSARQDNLIHFSDGTMTQAELNMETMLGREAIEAGNAGEQQVALPDNLVEVYRNLGVLGRILTGGSLVTLRVLQAFGTIGESVIDFFGITRPKYEYEINLAKEMKEQEQARNDKIENLYSSWQPSDRAQLPPSTFVPGAVPPMIPQEPQSGLSSMSTLSAALPPNNPSNIIYPSPSVQSVPSPYAVSSTPYPPPPQGASVQLSSPIPQAFSQSFVSSLPSAAAELIPATVATTQVSSALLTTESFSNIPDRPTDTVAHLAETTQNVSMITPTLIQSESFSQPATLLPSNNLEPLMNPQHSTDDVDPK